MSPVLELNHKNKTPNCIHIFARYWPVFKLVSLMQPVLEILNKTNVTDPNCLKTLNEYKNAV